MSFIKNNLIQGESVLMETKIHWISTIKGIYYTILGFVILFLNSYIFTTIQEYLKKGPSSKDVKPFIGIIEQLLVRMGYGQWLNLFKKYGTNLPKETTGFISPDKILFYLALALFLYSFFLIGKAVLEILTSEFAVTNQRVIVKLGILSTKSVEMKLEKIESVIINQNFIGNMFNFGSLTISGTGGVSIHCNRIINPLEFKKIIQENSSKKN